MFVDVGQSAGHIFRVPDLPEFTLTELEYVCERSLRCDVQFRYSNWMALAR
jgi:hypothetical protein